MLKTSLRWFPVVPQVKFPGISEVEAAVCNRLLKLNPLNFTCISYSIPLFSPIPLGFLRKKSPSRMWDYLSALKCDAYALSNNSSYLIEFKLNCVPSSVYQLLSYNRSFLTNFPDESPPILLLACEYCTAAARYISADNDILIAIV